MSRKKWEKWGRIFGCKSFCLLRCSFFWENVFFDFQAFWRGWDGLGDYKPIFSLAKLVTLMMKSWVGLMLGTTSSSVRSKRSL